MRKTFSVIIITYNNQHQIVDCLQSVFKNIEKLNTHLNGNIVIVDNNSKDQTLEIIRETLSSQENIFILKNKENTGFAKAVNQGIKFAQQKFDSDFHFLLNPDAILKEDCLERMFSNEDSADGDSTSTTEVKPPKLASPLIINPKTNKPWFSGSKINWLKFKTEHLKGGSTSACREQACLFSTSDYLSGCALLIPKKIIDKIGLFDEKFFLYYEDADFSLRAKKAGIHLKIILEAICYHEESQSSTSEIKNYHLVKSGLIFFHKHCSTTSNIVNRHACSLYFWLVFYLRLFYHKYFSHKKEVLQAMKDFKKDK